jgi:hypothetical protein
MTRVNVSAAALGALVAIAGACALAGLADLTIVGAGGQSGYVLVLLVLLYNAQRIPIVGDGNADSLDVATSSSWTLPLLGALLLVGALLTLGGAVAARRGGRGWLVGPAFSVGLFALGFVLSSSSAGPDVHPAHLRSLLFPLLLGTACGALGEALARDRGRALRRRLGRHLAVDAGLRALAVGICLGAVAWALIVAGAAIRHPHETWSVVGGRQVVAEAGLLPLYLPHLSAGGLVFAMDVPARFGGSGFFGDSSDGGHTDVGLFRDGMPGWLVLSPLIPLLAGLYGGMRAARGGGTARERLRPALGGAAAFAAGVLVIALYVRIAIEGQGVGFGIAGTFGFAPLRLLVGVLAWSALTFGAGALLQPVLGRRRAPTAASVAPPAQ